MDAIVVIAIWDPDAGVWSASSEDIDGLAIEAADRVLLSEKVRAAIEDLVALNGGDAGRAVMIRFLEP